MKRLALPLCLLCACVDFDTELRLRLDMLDAGNGTDSGTPDSGSTDAGMPDAGMPDAGMPDAGMPDAGMPDAGMPDAGMSCPSGTFCKVIELDLGDEMHAVIPDGHGHFLSMSSTGFGDQARSSLVYFDAGTYTANGALSFMFEDGPGGHVATPVQLAVRNDILAIADSSGFCVLLNRRDDTVRATQYCGTGNTQEPHGVAWLDDGTAAFAGHITGTIPPTVCRFSTDGGTNLVDYSSLGADLRFFSAISALPSGDIFLGDDTGHLVALLSADPTPHVWLGPSSASVRSIAGPDTNNVWAVFEYNGDGARFLPADAGWSPLNEPGEADINFAFGAVFVNAPDDIWVGANGGRLYHSTGGDWQLVGLDGLDTISHITSVALNGPNDLALSVTEDDGVSATHGRLLVYHRP